jgi:HEAT repeat protein
VLDTDRQEARDLVLGMLKDKDSRVRDAAVLALGKSGYKDAIPLIQNAAESDSDPAVREDALLALGLSGQKDAALPALLKALNSAGADRRSQRAAFAALGLGLLGEPQGAVEPLRKLYQTAIGRADQADEAACAAVALGMLGDAGSLETFAKVLPARAVSEHVKCYTLHAIGKFGSHPDEKVRAEALKLLLVGLAQKKKEIKQSAILALGSFGETRAIQALVKDGLGDSDNYCKNYAAHSLGRIAGRLGPASQEYRLVARELAKVTENENQDKWLFQAGNVALSSMAYADQEKALLERFEDLGKMNLHSASAVVVSLGMLGSESPAVAKQLQTAFDSRSMPTNIQAYAGLALAMSRAPGAADNLGKLLKGDSRPHADIARTAALALGLVGGAKDADILIECIRGSAGGQTADSAKFFLMGASVQGLGLIADGDTVKKLKPLLSATDWQQRAFAVAALGYVLEEKHEHRVSPRISGIFRHHNYHVTLPVVKAVQSSL